MVLRFTQLNNYSFVGIQREYNQLLTRESFCIGLLVTTCFAEILEHPCLLPSPRRTCHPRKSLIYTQNRDSEKCFESILVCKGFLAPQVLQTNSGRLGDLPKKILGGSIGQFFLNRVSSSWCFRENPTDDSQAIPPSIHHNRTSIDDFAPKIKSRTEKLFWDQTDERNLCSSKSIVVLVY